MSSESSDSSSYSDPWVAPETSLGLFTTVTTFRKGDLVRVSTSDYLFRVVSLRLTPGRPTADLTLREVVSSKKVVASTTEVAPLGREVRSSDEYDSGFDPGFLFDVSDRYLFLVGSQTYQVLLTGSVIDPDRPRPVKRVHLRAADHPSKRMVSKLKLNAEAAGWIVESSRRRGGSVVVCLEGSDGSDPFSDNPAAQARLYKALKKARPGHFGRPEARVVVIITRQIAGYGKSASLEAYSGKYLGRDVFFFSVTSRPSTRQTQAILGLSVTNRDVVADLVEGRLDVP